MILSKVGLGWALFLCTLLWLTITSSFDSTAFWCFSLLCTAFLHEVRCLRHGHKHIDHNRRHDLVLFASDQYRFKWTPNRHLNGHHWFCASFFRLRCFASFSWIDNRFASHFDWMFFSVLVEQSARRSLARDFGKIVDIR